MLNPASCVTATRGVRRLHGTHSGDRAATLYPLHILPRRVRVPFATCHADAHHPPLIPSYRFGLQRVHPGGTVVPTVEANSRFEHFSLPLLDHTGR